MIEVCEPGHSLLLQESKSAIGDGAILDPDRVDRFLAVHNTTRPPLASVEEVAEVTIGEFPDGSVVPPVAVECVKVREFYNAVVDDTALGEVVRRRHAKDLVVPRAVGGLPDPVDVIEMEAPLHLIGDAVRQVAGVHTVERLHLHYRVRPPLLPDDCKRGPTIEDDPRILDVDAVLVQSIDSGGILPRTTRGGIPIDGRLQSTCDARRNPHRIQGKRRRHRDDIRVAAHPAVIASPHPVEVPCSRRQPCDILHQNIPDAQATVSRQDRCEVCIRRNIEKVSCRSAGTVPVCRERYR